MKLKQENVEASNSKSLRVPIVDPTIFKPRKDCVDMKKKYNDSEGWQCFADVYKNPFWKQELAKKQKGICPVCGELFTQDEILQGCSIHHLSYDAECKFCSDKISVPYITSNPDKPSIVKVPNCAVCKYGKTDCYNTCKNALSLMHRECHMYLVHEKDKH